MTRLGLQIPNFTFPGLPDARLFEQVSAIAVQAEASGFDTLMVMDHFYQLPALGAPDQPMLEAYTLLGAIAARTRRVRLATLVTGNTYRNPALLAKIVTTLDVISGGRAVLGIGAGWFEPEHVGYGFPFPSLRDRLDRLEEALEIIRAMFRGERPSFDGRYYHTSDALNVPLPLRPGGPPILIGGNGEKRTLRLVAKYGDESNLTCEPSEIPRKLDALAHHCAELGRDPATIGKTWLGSVILAPTHELAVHARNDFLERRGLRWESLPEPLRATIDRALVIGDPDAVGERIQREILGAGLDGVVVNLPANGHLPEAIDLAASTLRKALG
ncbi:MAG TPA: LLM class F420-dependent oxidoreductase [Myxococcota bacterium]|jgi:F420-dependent oxidoreductase-like protein|nr:LLM class F420-dependent oxidoreductase [Myxococcota bacterium]